MPLHAGASFDPDTLPPHSAWVKHGKLLWHVRFPKPPAFRGTVETARTPHQNPWKRANGNTDALPVQALPGRTIRALPAPARADVPEWIRGERVRELIWELLAGTEYERGCWLWQGEKHPKGYGRFRRVVDGTKWDLLVHRAMWQYAVGPIPEGLTVDHQCEPVPRTHCANPLHLALVPRDANTRLRHQRERARTGV